MPCQEPAVVCGRRACFARLRAEAALGILMTVLAGAGCLYEIMRSEEGQLVQRFGSAYEQYMLSVPRTNFLGGILRLLTKRGSP